MRVGRSPIAINNSAYPPFAGGTGGGRPRWDCRRRVLCFGGATVKTFRKHSRNQELLLQAFEEADWPGEIDDPLPWREDVIFEERLRETVKQLQRTVAPGTIRFGVTGSGRRAYWCVVPAPPPEELAEHQ